MPTRRSMHSSARKDTGRARGRWTRLRVLAAAAAAAFAATTLLSGGTPFSAPVSAQGQGKSKRYKATRAYVPDAAPGAFRLPTAEEVDAVVAELTSLGQKDDASLQQSVQAGGAVGLDLDGGFAGVILTRPAADGIWETKCVFTLEEGLEFLGIVEDEPVR